jgi:RNA polymerase sigma factor (sigma-70 family)
MLALNPVDTYTPQFRLITAEPNIEKWLPLAKSVTAKYLGIPRAEAEYREEYSDALLGLWHAVQEYDPQRGFKFITFACYCIRREIRDGSKVRANQNKLNPTAINTSSDCDDSDDFIRRIGHTELVGEITDNKSIIKIDDLLAETAADTATEKRYKLVLRKHYLEGMAITEIAEEMSVSRQHVHQSVKDGLKMLREGISLT